MQGRPLFTRLCFWKVNPTYPWLRGSTLWRQALSTGSAFVTTTPLVKARQYSVRIKTSASSRSRTRKKFHTCYWTEGEDQILIQGIAEGLRYSEIAQKLRNRTVSACQTRASLFGLTRTKTSWSIEEDQILIQFSRDGLRGKQGGLRYSEIIQKLPGRSAMASQSRAALLGLTPKVPYWSIEEDQILSQGIRDGLRFSEIVQKLPGRSVQASRARASQHGLVPPRKPSWSTEEDQILSQGIRDGLRYSEIIQKLPGRSAMASQSRAGHLNLRPGFWSTEEDQIFSQGIRDGLRYSEISQKLPGRSLISCRQHAVHLGLTRTKNPPWSIEEEQILIQGISEGLVYREIAQKLPGRSVYACAAHAVNPRRNRRVQKQHRIQPDPAKSQVQVRYPLT